MKVTKLTIKNLGIIEDAVIPIDKPLGIFYGDIRQGKSTILNAVRWVFGGAFPADIIRHGCDEAAVTLEFIEDSGPGSVARSWYRAKDGSTKARDVSFIRNGKPVARPVEALKAMLNPFLLDQNHLRNMGETARRQYLAELFGASTPDLDREYTAAEQQAKTLRIQIKAVGAIDTTPVEKIDVEPLRRELVDMRAKFQQERIARGQKEREFLERTARVRQIDTDHSAALRVIKEMQDKMAELELEDRELTSWIEENPEPPAVEAPDTSEIEAKIADAAVSVERHKAWEDRVKRAEAKKADEAALLAEERKQREIKETRITRLAEVSKTSGIPDLIFNDDGSFTFNGTSDGMLSDSQIIELSSLLSAKYPPGFGLELLDRMESAGFHKIGKPVMEYLERAKRDSRTILATVVADKPAGAPAEIGVFVVEAGKVKP